MQGKGPFRIDLIDPSSGVKIGNFPILSAPTVRRRRILDRIGRWEFEMSGADPALAQIEGKHFDFYWQSQGETFYLGRGAYLNHYLTAGGDAPSLRVEAAGLLYELQKQTVLARAFDGATDDVNDVLNEIVPLRSGWTMGEMDPIITPAPLDFWYETIFDGVDLLAKTFGYHFREGSATRTVDFGAMGESSGVTAIGGQREIPPALYSNPTMCQITEMEVSYQGERVINRLIPFGGAVGVATIDLSETTETQVGYDVESAALPGGGNYYYLEDTTSQATYGLIERRFLRKDLRPISNSPAAREFAANVLYEATLASLLNLKDKQTIYSLSVSGLRPGQVDVGDKIQVVYRGWVNTSAKRIFFLRYHSRSVIRPVPRCRQAP